MNTTPPDDMLEVPPVLIRAMNDAGMISPSDYEPTARAAKVVGVPRETMRDAASRGAVETAKTPSGFVLVNVASAIVWAAARSDERLTDSELWGTA